METTLNFFLLLISCIEAFSGLQDEQSLTDNSKEILGSIQNETGKLLTEDKGVENKLPSMNWQVSREDLYSNLSCRSLKTQRILWKKGCTPVLITNNICAGLCSSIAFLRKGKLVRKCTSCQPAGSIEISVPLNCTKNSRRAVRKMMYKYEYVAGCECRKIRC